MTINRREALAAGAGALAVAGLGVSPALAETMEEHMAAFTGGAPVGEGGITLTAPEIAENGNTVPVEVSAPGAVAIAIFAPANPDAAVVTVNFGPLNPTQHVSTRMRLAKTQDVTAVAKMADGSFVQAASTVKVTIGGCGG